MIAETAREQHGVVSLTQLRAAGLGDGAIKWRVGRGRLHGVHRGVYAVGHRRLTMRGHLWAAVLAVPGAVLSHRSAAALWDLCPPPSGRIELSVVGQSRSTKKLRIHRVNQLESTIHERLPLTTVARTLSDLARRESRHRMERLVARAEHLRLLDTTSLTSQFRRAGGRRLEAALETVRQRGAEATRSELEERFLEAIANAGLARPEVNAIVEGYEVDFVWRDAKLIVETDGAATHLTASAFENDRRRDAVLMSAGWRVVRFTWRQVADGTATTTVRALL